MTARGVLFALNDEQADSLSSAEGDANVIAIIERIEEAWNTDWLAETDKAWDAMHRALTDGKLEYSNGDYPLKLTILAGFQLVETDNYVASITTEDEVGDVANSLSKIDKDKLRVGYNQIDPADYGSPLSDEDFEYTWSYFQDVAALYQRAAKEKRAVLFTVSQ